MHLDVIMMLYMLRRCWLLLVVTSLSAWSSVPTPAEHLGFSPGEDFKLADFSQISGYFEKLDKAIREWNRRSERCNRATAWNVAGTAPSWDMNDTWRWACWGEIFIRWVAC